MNVAKDFGKHDPKIDGYRGIAVLLVLIFHSFSHFRGPSEVTDTFTNIVYRLTDLGYLGVDLFFVLSGFLITRILLNTRRSSNYYRAFYARRAFRILPLYYLLLIFLFSIYPHLSLHPWFHDNQIWFWVYLQNWVLPHNPTYQGMLTHLWSLGVEEQFYLIWPLVIAFSSGKTIERLGILAVLLGAYIRWTYVSAGNSIPEIFMNSFSRFDRLLMGSAIAAALENGSLSFLFRWSKVIFWTSLLSFLSLDIVDFSVEGFKQTPFGNFVVGMTISGVMCMSVLLLLLKPERDSASSKWIFKPVFLQRIGKYSYAIYLFHLPLMYTLFPFFGSWSVFAGRHSLLVRGAFFLFILAISYVLAWISWHIYEAPFLNLKRHFPYRKAGSGLRKS